ncbi:MAG: M12 family metallo-peptidase [Phycisphaerae bacterium]|nr:M12 family metallo-peptidase [Phycisphaerae bacterium]
MQSSAETEAVVVKREQLARIDLQLPRIGEKGLMPLVLFPDRVFRGSVESSVVTAGGTLTVTGHIDYMPASRFAIVRHEGMIAGSIFAPGVGLFEIVPVEAGVSRVREIDETSGAARRCGFEDASVPELESARGASCVPSSVSRLSGYAADSAAQIDVMVAYTAAARVRAGGVAQIQALINVAMANANMIFADSQTNVQFRLVHTREVNYVEVVDYLTNLNRLANANDGFLDELYAERDLRGADFVSLWVDNIMNAGGAAYFPNALWPGDNGQSGNSVLRLDNANFFTLAHEFGHNFGCQHDRVTGPPGAWYNFSYGYREPGSVWATVMASPPGTILPYFSNPNLNYSGPLGNPGPMGVAGDDPLTSCDNARTIRLNAFSLANGRPSTLPSAPPSRIFVRANAPLGGNGASWGTAFRDLQDGIGTAVRSRGAVTEVWVAAGTYKPDGGTGERLRHFRPVEGVTISGGFVGNETQLSQRNIVANQTILSGDIGASLVTADNVYHVVIADNLNATAVLDGLYIEAGNADAGAWPHNSGGGLRAVCGNATLRNCTIRNNTAATFGGGVLLDGAAMTFVDCEIVGNAAEYGGGLLATNGAAPVFRGCRFEINDAYSGGGARFEFGATPTLELFCTIGMNQADFGGGLSFGTDVVAQVRDCDFEQNTGYAGVGARCEQNAVVEFSDCDFLGNSGSFGGGVENVDTSRPTYERCAFTLNLAGTFGSGSGVGGGMLNGVGTTVVVSGCDFSLNEAGFGAGGMGNFNCSPTLRDCSFTGNRSWYGGGIWNGDDALPDLRDCGFYGNIGQFGGGAAHHNNNSDATWINCVLSGNQSPQGVGGGIWNTTGADPLLINCTVANNTAAFGAGAIFDENGGARLRNVIVWANSNPQIAGNSATTSARYSDVSGGFAGTGNFNANPLFVDANGADNILGTADDDLSLAAGSPCLDRAENVQLPLDVFTDFGGSARFFDDPGAANLGVVDGRAPADVGADERSPTFAAGDMNCDGFVTVGDIGGFVLALTNPAGYAAQYPSCNINLADVNNDGFVTVGDIGSFVALLTAR